MPPKKAAPAFSSYSQQMEAASQLGPLAAPSGISAPVGDIIRRWDNGSRNARIAILTSFNDRHKGSTAADIERDLGHSALLFFTRVTAWLRLTYQLGYELSVQLSTLALFLQGQKFLTNFMEIGGIQTLTDLLCHVKFPLDKNNALLILIHISNSGRVYREMICDGAGVDNLVKSTVDETDDRALELTASLFMSLGQGNPRKASRVHAGLLLIMKSGNEAAALCAATTLRSLQLSKEHHSGVADAVSMVGAESGTKESNEALIAAFFHLLSVDSVKLRFEGTELLSIAAKNPMLIVPIVTRCLDIIDNDEPVIRDDGGQHQLSVQRKQAACGRIVCNVLLRPMQDDSRQRLLLLLDRRSAHITLAKFLRISESKDVNAQVDCCRALKLLALGPFATTASAGDALTTAAKWLRARVGETLFEEFIERDDYTDGFVARFTAAIRIKHREEELDEDPEGGLIGRDVHIAESMVFGGGGGGGGDGSGGGTRSPHLAH